MPIAADHLYEPVGDHRVMAHQFLGHSLPSLPPWVRQTVSQQTDGALHVNTVNGTEACRPGDWIVKTLAGVVRIFHDGDFRAEHVVPEEDDAERGGRELVPVEAEAAAHRREVLGERYDAPPPARASAESPPPAATETVVAAPAHVVAPQPGTGASIPTPTASPPSPQI